MADVIDLANVCDLIDYEVNRAIKKMRKDVPVKPQELSNLCIECEDIIQKARLELGYTRCIKCAKELERKKSQFVDDGNT